MSWERSKTVEKYARNRFLRLFPALFVCFIITQFLLLLFFFFWGGVYQFAKFPEPTNVGVLDWTIDAVSILHS